MMVGSVGNVYTESTFSIKPLVDATVDGIRKA